MKDCFRKERCKYEKIVVLEENEVEVLNKNLTIAFAFANQLNLDGKDKEKINGIVNSLKEIIDTLQ